MLHTLFSSILRKSVEKKPEKIVEKWARKKDRQIYIKEKGNRQVGEWGEELSECNARLVLKLQTSKVVQKNTLNKIPFPLVFVSLSCQDFARFATLFFLFPFSWPHHTQQKSKENTDFMI